MIQFNLLPDVKQQYIKAKRLKHSTVVISILVASASLFIFTLLFLTVHLFQPRQLKEINSDIQTNITTLKNTKDLNKVLTIQNQLKSLPGLHDKKPVTSRLFTFVGQLTPAQASIASIKLDFVASTISLSGNADSLATINKFVDTFKFTNYSDGTDATKDNPPAAFSEVVLASFARSDTDASYTINFKFDPAIFDSSKQITLIVPDKITTRSETEKPTDLFKAAPEVKKQ